MSATLGWIPLLDPMPVFHDWWYLLIVPLSFGISVIYKAMRVQSLAQFWRQVAVMTTQIVGAMVALAVCLVIIVQIVIPMLPVRE